MKPENKDKLRKASYLIDEAIELLDEVYADDKEYHDDPNINFLNNRVEDAREIVQTVMVEYFFDEKIS